MGGLEAAFWEAVLEAALEEGLLGVGSTGAATAAGAVAALGDTLVGGLDAALEAGFVVSSQTGMVSTGCWSQAEVGSTGGWSQLVFCCAGSLFQFCCAGSLFQPVLSCAGQVVLT